MKLKITTPLTVVVDADDVIALRAEDASGSFGILRGHVDFLTSLAVSVVAWTDAGKATTIAVRRGVLSVTGGDQIAIATREAIAGDELETLDQVVLARFRADLDVERNERVAATRLQLNAIRQIMRHLLPNGHQNRDITP